MTKLLVTVDIVLFTIRDRQLHLLLIKRLAEPFVSCFALPGGFVLEEESLDAAASRELREETGVEKVYLEQLYTFGDPQRDPRGRVVTVAYYALVPGTHVLRAGTDASDAAWFPVTKLPELAFDHRKIVEYAHQRLRNKLDYTNVGFELLPDNSLSRNSSWCTKPFLTRGSIKGISGVRSFKRASSRRRRNGSELAASQLSFIASASKAGVFACAFSVGATARVPRAGSGPARPRTKNRPV